MKTERKKKCNVGDPTGVELMMPKDELVDNWKKCGRSRQQAWGIVDQTIWRWCRPYGAGQEEDWEATKVGARGRNMGDRCNTVQAVADQGPV